MIRIEEPKRKRVEMAGIDCSRSAPDGWAPMAGRPNPHSQHALKES